MEALAAFVEVLVQDIDVECRYLWLVWRILIHVICTINLLLSINVLVFSAQIDHHFGDVAFLFRRRAREMFVLIFIYFSFEVLTQITKIDDYLWHVALGNGASLQ